MSGQPQKKQQGGGKNQPQKRKAEGQAEGQQQKKANQAQQPKQKPQAAKPQQQQAKKEGGKPQQAKKEGGKPQQAPAQGKKAAKKVVPEPESEDEEGADAAMLGGEDDSDDGEDGPLGERNEEALAAIEKVQPQMEKIEAQLQAFDEAMNAEIYAIQKKFLLKKRPVLESRDKIVASVKGCWPTLFKEHMSIAAQLDDVDVEILDHLTSVSETQVYTEGEKQQIKGCSITFIFSEGSKHVKAGSYTKQFEFDDEKEVLMCIPAKKLPFVAADFAKKHADSFFLSWFQSEGADDGILAAQDAISAELYVDPLQLFAHLSEGNPYPDMGSGSEDENDMSDMMEFGEDGEEESDDEDAPTLVD